MSRLTIAALTLALLLAPQFAPAAMAQTAGTMVFEDVTPIKVNATALVVEIENQPPREYPHVAHRSPITFEQAVRSWAAGHFALTGQGENTLRIHMRDADIVEKLLPVKRGIAGWFRKDQAAEYSATIDLSVALVDVNGKVLGTAEAKSWHSTTMTEGATEADKRAAWNDMIRKTFGNLDREIQPKIRQALASYVE